LKICSNFSECLLFNNFFSKKARCSLQLSEATASLSEGLTVHACVFTIHLIFGQDSSLKSDGFGSIDVVTSDHADVDTGLVADTDRSHDLISKWILKSIDTNKGQILLKSLSVALLFEIIILLFKSKIFLLGVVGIGNK